MYHQLKDFIRLCIKLFGFCLHPAQLLSIFFRSIIYVILSKASLEAKSKGPIVMIKILHFAYAFVQNDSIYKLYTLSNKSTQ